ncbi:hypothetical protein ACOME3_001771 [Neoechinorhynchus agilis]
MTTQPASFDANPQQQQQPATGAANNNTLTTTDQHQQVRQTSAVVHGGRFDFDDGGTYCGGWEDGKAHGFGVCTGPKGLGEFSGFWQFGYEVSGVYLWPSGNRYEGQWMSGKRHGLGVEKKGRWIYKGEWTQGFKGRYGVRISERSGAKFEGTWANGLQDGYGAETYGDGGTYFGQISQGLRSGYGIRRSVPYGVAARYKLKHFSDSLTSLRSCGGATNALIGGPSDDHFRVTKERRVEENRGGFVLRDRFSDAHLTPSNTINQQHHGTPKSSLRRTIMAKLRKQKSVGDTPDYVSGKKVNSFHSNTSTGSYESKHSSRTVPTGGGAYEDDRLSGYDRRPDSHHESIDDDGAQAATDPNVIESYMGEWKADKRTGFGIAERSDGIRYEGEWLNNKKNGYGITTHRDGSREEGKYKNNVLVSSRHRFGQILSLRLSKIHERAEFAASSAMSAAQSAQQKAEIAASRANNARAKAQAAEVSAKQARHESQTARKRAEEIAPDFKQPGVIHSDTEIQLDIDAKGDGGHFVVQNHVGHHQPHISAPPQMFPPFPGHGRQSATFGFNPMQQQQQFHQLQPPSFIPTDFSATGILPRQHNIQHQISPQHRYTTQSGYRPHLQDWRPMSAYGFNVSGMEGMETFRPTNHRPSRFSTGASRLEWQQHPVKSQNASICHSLIVRNEDEFHNQQIPRIPHSAPFPMDQFPPRPSVYEDARQFPTQPSVMRSQYPNLSPSNRNSGDVTDRTSLIEQPQSTPIQQVPVMESRGARQSHRARLTGQKSVDTATLRMHRDISDRDFSMPGSHLRRRKSLPSIVHSAIVPPNQATKQKKKSEHPTVALLLRSKHDTASVNREKTFVIDNGIRKRVREIKCRDYDQRKSNDALLFSNTGRNSVQQGLQASPTDGRDVMARKKVPLQWSIVEESPQLSRKIVLEQVDSSHRRSIPENIDTAHLKGLSREEVCALSSKRRQELREERRLRENPVLWLSVCTLNVLRRHRLAVIIIVLINVTIMLWWLFYFRSSSSRTRTRPRDGHS